MKKGSKKKTVALCAAILAAGAIAGGALAYMSDTDSGINTLTIGHVEISATEPGFPTKDDNNNKVPDDCELVIPYETITKDPRIKNIGKNDAIVFFKVTAPVEELTLISDDGGRGNPALDDLFWFKQKGDADDKHANNFNSSWIRLTGIDGQIVNCPGVNAEGKGKTYIFGYHTRIKPGESTKTLFDKVQNKKYGSKTIGPNEVETIRIDSYAVQADDIRKSGVTVNTSGEISAADLTYIYNAFVNQNKDRLD